MHWASVSTCEPQQGAVFTHRVNVGFGDCDPARIAFYPNYFRWFDAAYNAFLFQYFGSFEEALTRINTIGTGAMEVGARFHSPVVPGDELELELRLGSWSRKSFQVDYLGTCKGRRVISGFEVRGVFVRVDGKVKAGSTAGLRRALGLADLP